ncbi:Mov34/MPN/PAD-1 family protein [Sphingorhabdus lutea]|uniref:Mov34/MPN/PAD-1 family protein n=1 Tax=Sphingorhabdus lutea TaxID=1913578 RepID=UPI0018DC1F4F|nr:Mov34/MPN/PAD-1 family protein [Sphingorhabdus lutea]
MLHHAAMHHDEEICGFIFYDNIKKAQLFILAQNIAANRARHFEIEHRILFEILRRERLDEVRVDAIFHSHPNGDIRPSKYDIMSAIQYAWPWLIIAGNEMAMWHMPQEMSIENINLPCRVPIIIKSS